MTGLILEGGGMRGAFTAGVLDALMGSGIEFDNVYGVSAGASNAASFVSKQQGRNRKVFVEGIRNRSYFSLRCLPAQRSLLDIRLLFDIYPNRLIPFDYETFEKSPVKLYTVLCDCESGRPVYIEKSTVNRRDFMMKVLAGSNSLPLVSPPVNIRGRLYLDGGLADSIPLERAMSDGCSRNLVIMTREQGYRKKPSKGAVLVAAAYRRYPAVTECFRTRHTAYNSCLDFCEEKEKDGSAMIIRPETTMGVSRTENSYRRLSALYDHGFKTGSRRSDEIRQYLENSLY